MPTVFPFLFRRGHESIVRLQPPGGQLVPGDPAQPWEGQLRHRALQQQALHHRGKGREERGHCHRAVLGPWGPETDRRVCPAPGGVAPWQRHHQEVLHPHPEDRARSRVSVTGQGHQVPGDHPLYLLPGFMPLKTAGWPWAMGPTPGLPMGAPWKSQL